MVQPGQPADLDITVLDEGRQRIFPPRGGTALDETVVDAGRRRPGPAPQGVGELPGSLSERYLLIERMERTASQGELYRVRVRADGTEAAVKIYRGGREPDAGLVAYLSVDHPHVVRLLETGPGYEVMRFVAGCTLRELQTANVRGFDFAFLRAIVEQTAAALIDLHRAKYVHRDVKPANIMLPPAGRIDVTLIDYGIAAPADADPGPEQPNRAYQPPEAEIEVTEAVDWWGLGMTIVELASGAHPFADLPGQEIRNHFLRGRPVDVSGVPDEPGDGSRRRDRLRTLCQGLLWVDAPDRWGADQVGRWLVGEDPELPMAAAPPGGSVEPGEAAVGLRYRFLGREYFLRDQLALALTTNWDHAVEVLFDSGSALDKLGEWLEQFPDDASESARGVVANAAADSALPGHVRLLNVARALDPTRKPVYRNHLISRHNLATIAHEALLNEGNAPQVLEDLWRHHLLPAFDTAAPDAPEAGGQALADLERSWIKAHDAWPSLVGEVDDRRAQEHLRSTADEREVLAVTLRMALLLPDDLAQTRAELRRQAAGLPVHLRWFERLLNRREMVWVAVLLADHATARAHSIQAAVEAREQHQDFLRANHAFREWSRRQNRPAALGWAVAGICLLAVAWIVPIVVSDRIGWAGDREITLAWVDASGCLAVALVAECLLAAEIGGRFHHRYSIPGAGVIALRPLGRWMQQNRLLAFVTILAAVTVAVVAALSFPQVVPVVTTIAQLIWVVRRLRAWRAERDADDALIAEAQRRQQQEMEAAAEGADR